MILPGLLGIVKSGVIYVIKSFYFPQRKYNLDYQTARKHLGRFGLVSHAHTIKTKDLSGKSLTHHSNGNFLLEILSIPQTLSCSPSGNSFFFFNLQSKKASDFHFSFRYRSGFSCE